MAAQVLSLDAIKVLLSLGANRSVKNCKSLTPIECIPSSFEHIEADYGKIMAIVEKIKDEFDNEEVTKTQKVKQKKKFASYSEAFEKKHSPSIQKPKTRSLNKKDYSQSDMDALQNIGLSIGCRVLVSGNKSAGVLRYYNETEFNTLFNMWAGVELDEPTGKNNGTIDGIEYFKCPDKHGLFTQLSKLKKEELTSGSSLFNSLGISNLACTSPVIDLSNTTLTRSSSAASATETSAISPGLEMGSYVNIEGGRRGIIRFIGQTKFAAGQWVN